MRLSYVLFAAAFSQLANGQVSKGKFLRSTSSAQPVIPTRALRVNSSIEYDSEERMNRLRIDKTSLLYGFGSKVAIPNNLRLKMDDLYSRGDTKWLSSEDFFIEWKDDVLKQSPATPYKEMTKALINEFGVVEFVMIVESARKSGQELPNTFRNEMMNIWLESRLSAQIVFNKLVTANIRIDDNHPTHTVLFQLWLDYAAKQRINDVSKVIENALPYYEMSTLVRLQAVVEQASHTILNEHWQKILHLIANEIASQSPLRQAVSAASARFSTLAHLANYQSSLFSEGHFFEWMTDIKNKGASSVNLIEIIEKHYDIPTLLPIISGIANVQSTKIFADELQSSLLVCLRHRNIDGDSIFGYFRLSVHFDGTDIIYQKYWMNAWFKFVQLTEPDRNKAATIIIDVFQSNNAVNEEIVYWLKNIDQVTPVVVEVWSRTIELYRNEYEPGEKLYEILGLGSDKTIEELINDPLYKVWKRFMLDGNDYTSTWIQMHDILSSKGIH